MTRRGMNNVWVLASAVVLVWGASRSNAGATLSGSVVAWGCECPECNRGQCDPPPGENVDFAAISAGGYHNLALKKDGSIVAWGCQIEDFGHCVVPKPNIEFAAVAAGLRHSLGLKSDGSVVAWGSNLDNNGNYAGQSAVPAEATGCTAIAAGDYHSLCLRSDGSIVCWGWDASGQCTVPPEAADCTALAAGAHHSLGLKSDGSIIAWGCSGQDYGQCNVPEPNTGWVHIAAGAVHSEGVRSNGILHRWGYNSGDTGEANDPDPNTDFASSDGGHGHSIALKSYSRIVAWLCGSQYPAACQVPSPNTGFIAVSAGNWHSLALRAGPDCDADGIPDGWELADRSNWKLNRNNGHYYRLTSAPRTWPDAQLEAEAQGGYLATIADADEADWLLASWPQKQFPNLWIGLRLVDGVWGWGNGEPIVYENWIPGEPTGDGVYAEMNHDEAYPGKWNDEHDIPGGQFGIIERLTPPATDCNGNGVLDECDLAGDVSEDCNGNELPDECDPDCDGDGLIDACDSDTDNDGILGVGDLCPCSYGMRVDAMGRPLGDLDQDCDIDLVDFGILQENFSGRHSVGIRYHVDPSCPNGVRHCTTGVCSDGYPSDAGPLVGRTEAQCGPVVDPNCANVTCVLSLGCSSDVQSCDGGICMALESCSDYIDPAGGVNCD